MREAWAKFYLEWGAVMMEMSNIFGEWARASYQKSASLYYQEAVDLAEEIKVLSVEFVDADDPHIHGRAWDFSVLPRILDREEAWPTLDENEGMEKVHGDEAPS